jgi:hypothetical protein
MERKENANKPANEIRVGFQSRVRNLINYANVLLKESNYRTIYLSAIGGAIGSLVNAVEVIKINNPGLYQVNKIGTMAYQTVDNQGSVQNQRYYPKMDVVLTLDEPKETGPGFQEKLSEEERSKLLALSQERRREPRQDDEGRGRVARGRGRGRGRGGRGRGGRGRPIRDDNDRNFSRGPSRPRGGFGIRGRGRGRGGFSNRGRGGDRGGRGFGGRPFRGRGGN